MSSQLLLHRLGRYDAPLRDALRAIDRARLTVVPVVSPELASDGPEEGNFVLRSERRVSTSEVAAPSVSNRWSS